MHMNEPGGAVAKGIAVREIQRGRRTKRDLIYSLSMHKDFFNFQYFHDIVLSVHACSKGANCFMQHMVESVNNKRFCQPKPNFS